MRYIVIQTPPGTPVAEFELKIDANRFVEMMNELTGHAAFRVEEKT